MNNCHMMYNDHTRYDHNYIYYNYFYENGTFKVVEIKNIQTIMSSNDSYGNYTIDTHLLRVHKCYPRSSHYYILYMRGFFL